jgi:cation transport protein ChaC
MDDAFWVFAYGSLMWRPGFKVAETQPATVYGYHRAMCVTSYHYRGTKENPGLVLGLDRGGSCHGLALRVAKSRVKATIAYLDERELVSHAYAPRVLNAVLADGRRVPVYAYVVQRDHPQYAGQLTQKRTVEIIRKAVGQNGTARDYLANTVAHMDAMCLCDRRLRRLLALVDAPKEKAKR